MKKSANDNELSRAFHRAVAPAEDAPRFNLSEAAREFYAAFPQLKQRIFFLDASTNLLHHPDAAICDRAIDMVNKDLNVSNAYMRNRKDRMSVMVKGFGFHVALLYPDNPLDRLFGKRAPMEQRQHFVFDHELGHALVKPYSENAADAYAALRHIQRYGSITLVEQVMLHRAQANIMQHDTHGVLEHNTCAALKDVINRARVTDIAKLTPAETAKLAETIAAKFPQAEVSKLRRDFADAFAGYNAEAPAETRVRDLAKAVMTTKLPEAGLSGGLVLNALLQGKLYHANDDGSTLSLQGREWDVIRAQMKRHNKHAARVDKTTQKQGKNPAP